MIRIVQGSILDDDAETLVNPVNCVGVCGKGLALEFKKKFPKNYIEYKDACNTGLLKAGEIYTTRHVDDSGRILHIVNFATKDHWRNKSLATWITNGLESLSLWINSNDIKKIAIPPLGCGLGNLNFDEIKPIIINWSEKNVPKVLVNLYCYR